MLIRLTGNVRVTLSGDQAAIKEKLDGIQSADSTLHHLPQSLAELGIEGGKIVLKYDSSSGEFRAVTEFRAPEPLTERQLRNLQEFTAGQWCDGLGAGCFADIASELGANIELLPIDEDDSITVSQVDDGIATSRKCAVYHAANKGDLAKVRELLGAGADIEEAFESGTPLHAAVLAGHRDVAMELIQHGANVFAMDEVGCDALVFTALSNKSADADAADITVAILERGALPNGERDGLTPLFMARNRSKTRLESVLIKYGAS